MKLQLFDQLDTSFFFTFYHYQQIQASILCPCFQLEIYPQLNGFWLWLVLELYFFSEQFAQYCCPLHSSGISVSFFGAKFHSVACKTPTTNSTSQSHFSQDRLPRFHGMINLQEQLEWHLTHRFYEIDLPL